MGVKFFWKNEGNTIRNIVPIVLLASLPLLNLVFRAILCIEKRVPRSPFVAPQELPDNLRTALLLLLCGRAQNLMCCMAVRDCQAVEVYLVYASRIKRISVQLKGR